MMKEYLTPREVDVLRGAARGELARETAARLGISPETTRKQRQVIMRKLGAKTIAQAVAIHLGDVS